MDHTKRYTLSGIDGQGDVHAFASENAERATGAYLLFIKDYSDVQRSEPLMAWMDAATSNGPRD